MTETHELTAVMLPRDLLDQCEALRLDARVIAERAIRDELVRRTLPLEPLDPRITAAVMSAWNALHRGDKDRIARLLRLDAGGGVFESDAMTDRRRLSQALRLGCLERLVRKAHAMLPRPSEAEQAADEHDPEQHEQGAPASC